MLGIIWKEIFHFKFFKIFFSFVGNISKTALIIQLSHSTVCTNSLRKQFAQRVCTTLIKTHMNSALLPIALYLCFLLWLVYLIGRTLLYLCLILYNSITCGCASCSAHRKLLEGYVGSGPCATRHLLSTSYQHNIIDSGHTCLTCVPAVIVIMYTAGQIIESQAWLMMLSSNWRVTPVYYVYTRVATCMAPERPRVPGRHYIHVRHAEHPRAPCL